MATPDNAKPEVLEVATRRNRRTHAKRVQNGKQIGIQEEARNTGIDTTFLFPNCATTEEEESDERLWDDKFSREREKLDRLSSEARQAILDCKAIPLK